MLRGFGELKEMDAVKNKTEIDLIIIISNFKIRWITLNKNTNIVKFDFTFLKKCSWWKMEGGRWQNQFKHAQNHENTIHGFQI